MDCAQADAQGPAFPQSRHLPAHLQSTILACGGAPLNTCKASAEILTDDSLLGTWVTAAGGRLRSPLKTAALRGLWRVCCILLQCHAYDQDCYELSHALYHAAAAGQVEVVQALIEAGGWEDTLWGGWAGVVLDLHAIFYGGVNKDDWTEADYSYAHLGRLGHPLHAAAGNGHVGVVSLLLEQPMRADIIRTAVCSAARSGRLAVVKLLATERPDASAPEPGGAPLIVAAECGHLPVVQYFLGQGADISNRPNTPWAGDHEYNSALAAAAAAGHPGVMKLLLETAVTAGMGGAITQDTLSSALNQAAAAGHLQVLHMLLDVGMPLAELLPEAFSSAAFGGRLKAARLLLSRMLPAGQWEEGYRGKFTQRSLLYYNHPLVTAASSGRTGIVQLVIDSGGSFSSNVLTAALMNATRYEYLPVMQLLLETGADVNGGQGTSYHESPLYEAVSSQRWAAAEVLLQKGAHVGSPALMHAINTYAPPCAYHVLLCYACDKDNQALFAAAFRRQHEVVDALLAAGGTPTSIEALAGRYEAALCGAASAHHLALVKSLLESANKKLREQPAGPALLKHLLNKPLQAAIAGLQYALEQLCARDDGQEGRMSQHLLQSEREAMKYSRARRDDTTIVRLLLEQGADPDHEEGRPLVMAVRQHRADMVRLLFAAGAVKTEQAVKAAAEAGYDDLVGQLLHHIQGSS